MEKVNLNSKAARILYIMLLLVEEGNFKLKFEDIVVKSFEMFPDVFRLGKYKNFPDSHKVNRSIYTDLKPRGLIKTYGTGYYELTPTGYNIAKAFKINKGKITGFIEERYEKEKTQILRRLLNSQAYKMYINKELDSIVDSDFFNFYRVSIRMKKNDFLNNIELIYKTIKEAKEKGIEGSDSLMELNNFLINRYSQIIENKGVSIGNKDFS